MGLVFGPDDGDGFAAARTSLLEHFELWLGRQGMAPEGDEAEVAVEAGLALDWKWGYGDGDLGRWTLPDISEFLLKWCPRTLSVPEDECATIPVSLAAFTSFLGDQGLLAAEERREGSQ